MLTAPLRAKTNMTGSHRTSAGAERDEALEWISQAALIVWKCASSTFPRASGRREEETRGHEARVVKQTLHHLHVCMCLLLLLWLYS